MLLWGWLLVAVAVGCMSNILCSASARVRFELLLPLSVSGFKCAHRQCCLHRWHMVRSPAGCIASP
jgi:hypothetical protein